MARQNGIRCLALLVVLLSVPYTASQAGSADVKAEAVVTTTASQVPETNPQVLKPRIKYRNGPVCMCNGGMSEAEIQAGIKKRNQQ